MGGAIVIQQALNSGLVDSVHLRVAPIILGAGTRLFDNLPHADRDSGVHLRHTSHIRFTHHGRSERPSARPTSNQGVRSHNRLTIRDVATRLPAQDLDRTQHFYSQTLGLEPAEARPGGLRHQWRPRLVRALRVNGKGLGNADAVIPGLIPRDPAQPVP
jgi:hypothetical protein